MFCFSLADDAIVSYLIFWLISVCLLYESGGSILNYIANSQNLTNLLGVYYFHLLASLCKLTRIDVGQMCHAMNWGLECLVIN